MADEDRDKREGGADEPDTEEEEAARDAEVSAIIDRAAKLGFDPGRVSNALGVRPAGRDERARDRDDAADRRDEQAESFDASAGEDESMTERERAARRLARDDRDAAGADRREAEADRANAADARDASRRSGE